MAIVGALLPDLNRQFTDGNGVPLAGGFVESVVTGTATAKDLFSQADLDPGSVLANPAELDSEGRLTAFMEPGAYDFIVSDSDSVELYTVSGVEDYGLTYLPTLGVQLAQGGTMVTSGYTVLPTDTLVRVNSTGGPDPCIINAGNVVDHPLLLTIKNYGNVKVWFTPYSVQTVDGVNSVFEIPAAATYKPSIFMANDGISDWEILASHKLG